MLSKCLKKILQTSIHRPCIGISKEIKATNCQFSTIQQVFSNRFYSQNTRGSPPKPVQQSRSTKPKPQNESQQSIAYYSMAAVVLCAGLSYAAVPLYRLFCQSTGFGGTVNENHDASKVEQMKPVKNRVLKIQFNADLSASMRWNFKPQQYEIRV